MEFDQNSLPKDLRTPNVVRNVADETRIAPSVPTTSGRVPDGYYHPPTRGDATSPPPMTLYYTDARGLPGLGFMNPAGVVPGQQPGWPVCMRSPVGPPASSAANVCSSGSVHTTNHAARAAASVAGTGPPSDKTSEEGGDDSVSGRKVKFLCSFGGKIHPRLSDGTLRYVGGETRIISVKRNVTFPELVQKMIDVYGQPVVIKYQLPYEDLDALVSVSCTDDLENMMEEYAKLLESSPDGSAKLRVFLFSASDLDSTGLVQSGSLQDSGHKYVDAVNGIVKGSGGGLVRKESMASAGSTQNSDVSATEILDPVANQDSTGQQSTGIFTPVSDLAASNDNASILEAPLLVSPVVVPPPSSTTQLEIDRERNILPRAQLQGYDLQQTRMNFPPPPSQFVNYDPHGGAFSSSQVVYADPQLLGAPRPIVIQPQYVDNGPAMLAKAQQYIPAVQVTNAPGSTHPSIYPNIVPIPQSQRMVALPADLGLNSVYPPQVGGGYGWPQVIQEQVPFSEGWMPHHEVVCKAMDCYMCKRDLPHAHSDTVVQDQKDTHLAAVSDTNPLCHSLRFDDFSRVRALAPVTHGMMGLGGDVHVPHSAITGNFSVSRPGEACVQHSIASAQPFQELLVSHPVTSDGSPVAVAAYPCQESYVPETSKGLSGKVAGNAYREETTRSSILTDTVKTVDYVMENLRFKTLDILPGADQNKSPSDQFQRDDIFDQGREATPVNNFIAPAPAPPPAQELLHPVDPFEGLKSNPTMVADRVVSSINVQALVLDQDPWDMRPDFPPPKPMKLNMNRESSMKEFHVDSGQPTSDQFQSSKAEERIKQQLQETVEEVTTSVLISSVPSNTDFPSQESALQAGPEMEGQNSDVQMQTKMEVLNIKPEKANIGFPMSDGMGRLQIIKNCDLEELRELGSGTFGTVYHGKWRGTDVAIKRINDRCFDGKTSGQERLRDDFWNEAIKLADLHHPNVLAFYGVVLDGPGGSVATVTEYMVNGSLRTALQKNERNLDKRKHLLIAMDVAFGMEYLHSKNIVHFDLKSDNLLVNLRDPHRPICKVGDLGLSKVKCQTLISGGVRGTLPWMAPELLNGSSSLVSEKIDVFSFGIVLWELLTGEEPYADLHYGAIIGGIVSNTLRPQVPESCDPEWKSLMERCWSVEPSERPSFTTIANELRCMAGKVPPKVQAPTAKTNA